MMRHIDGSLDADHLDHKNDLKKDIFRRKAQLNQVQKPIMSWCKITIPPIKKMDVLFDIFVTLLDIFSDGRLFTERIGSIFESYLG